MSNMLGTLREALGRGDQKTLLFLLAIGNTIAFATWQVLLNNFVVEEASFTGKEIGLLQSLREVPGFLAFTAILVMIYLRQQTFALLSLATLGIGTAITAFFPQALWLYFATVLMSIGFHYLETLQNSLSLQWLSKEEAPVVMGQLLSVKSLCNFAILSALYLYLALFSANYILIYGLAGGAAVAIAVYCRLRIPYFPDAVIQRKTLFLRKRYWLYYSLTFLAGARRQIFVVFAGFLLVEKFDFPIEDVVMLTLVNAVLTFYLAPKIGRLIARIGERRGRAFAHRVMARRIAEAAARLGAEPRRHRLQDLGAQRARRRMIEVQGVVEVQRLIEGGHERVRRCAPRHPSR